MESNQVSQSSFRKWLPDLTLERFTKMRDQNAHQYADDFFKLAQPPWLKALLAFWQELAQEPFKGVTNDGAMIPEAILSIQGVANNMQDVFAPISSDFKMRRCRWWT